MGETTNNTLKFNTVLKSRCTEALQSLAESRMFTQSTDCSIH